MKNYLIIGLIALISISCKRDVETNSPESRLDSIDSPTTADVNAADAIKSDHCKLATDFLTHYAKNYDKIYEHDFINYGDVYSLNLKAVDAYIEKARLPQYFTDEYNTKLVSFFMKIDKNLKAHPQNDGPVDGLESDLILHTQDIDEVLHQIKTRNMVCKVVSPNEVMIDFKNTHRLIFTFDDDKIDDIDVK